MGLTVAALVKRRALRSKTTGVSESVYGKITRPAIATDDFVIELNRIEIAELAKTKNVIAELRGRRGRRRGWTPAPLRDPRPARSLPFPHLVRRTSHEVQTKGFAQAG